MSFISNHNRKTLVVSLIVMLLTVPVCNVASAAEDPFLPVDPTAANPDATPEVNNPMPWIYVGLDEGPAWLGGTTGAELSKSGNQFSLKAVASFYKPNWVLDAGLGYFNSNLSSSGPNETRVVTNGGFLEFSPRYLIQKPWQIGPVFNIFFSSDASFSDDVNSSSALSLFGGVRGQYETRINKYSARAGLQALTDFSISARQIWMLQIDLQIGIPLF